MMRPLSSDADRGVAEVVSYHNVPDSLTVKMPRGMSAGRTYAIRVVTDSNEWSNTAFINDARLFWISPSRVEDVSSEPALPRYLKVIGRSLRLTADSAAYVKLTGPENVMVEAPPDPQASQAYSQSVVTISLPGRLAPGEYDVQLSRDRIHWQKLAGQRLEVRAARPLPQFSLAARAFGGCRPNDGKDDTACLVSAKRAAEAAGGGTVFFPPGEWDFADASTPGVAVGDGFVLPLGTSLRGAGSRLTTIKRMSSWNNGSTNALFSLQGQNDVSGIRFQDERRYTALDPPNPLIQLGLTWYRRASGPASVDDVRIFDNVFDRPRIAIAAGGLPIRRLTVTRNEFGAFFTGLTLGGDRSNIRQAFQIEDSIIAQNTFRPGSYRDVAAGQGTMASAIGAGLRLDFSGNVADGAATQYLYEPKDPRGWRAGFFWHMNNSSEMVLISRNTATCTGDKAGDGEAIALDNNANTFAFERAVGVIASGPDSVGVDGPLQAKQSGRDVDVARYYLGHWIQVVEGPGVGQSRKIASYEIDPATKRIVFRVYPRWDVPPVANASKITAGREFWQTYILDNHIDQRRPLCQKSNATKPAGGRIAIWAQSSDSLVAGNQQYDTDGIIVQQTYTGSDPTCPGCSPGMMLQGFLTISENRVEGEYAWNSDCSQSGITMAHSASQTPNAPPPIVSYGVSIAHNTIVHSDGMTGGAITVPATWFRGPMPHRWPVVNNLLIYGNSVNDIAGAPAEHKCEDQLRPRLGINIGNTGLVWRTVLYNNRCLRVEKPLFDGGILTTAVCPSGEANSCECAGTKPLQ
jgi:hypothetical protein